MLPNYGLTEGEDDFVSGNSSIKKIQFDISTILCFSMVTYFPYFLFSSFRLPLHINVYSFISFVVSFYLSH